MDSPTKLTSTCTYLGLTEKPYPCIPAPSFLSLFSISALRHPVAQFLNSHQDYKGVIKMGRIFCWLVAELP